MTDFTDYTGINDAATGSVDTKVFRICYLKDIEQGRLLKRYAANNTTAAIGSTGSYANTSDLYAYSFDSTTTVRQITCMSPARARWRPHGPIRRRCPGTRFAKR